MTVNLKLQSQTLTENQDVSATSFIGSAIDTSGSLPTSSAEID